MEDQIDQPSMKHNRPKITNSYKDQFLQEISTYIRETDFLVNNPTNEGNSSTRRAKEAMISTENIPPELDDPYHKRTSQIPKRPKAQQTTQKKSLIPTPTRTSKKNSRKSDTKNSGLKDNLAIVPLTDDDLTHFFDFANGSISNEESSPLQSPDNIKSEINQKKRSKSPGPRLNSNNKNSISEKHPAKRSKSPSVVRKRVRKSNKSTNNSPKLNSPNKQEDKLLTPTMNDNLPYSNNDDFLIEDDQLENEGFHTPQNNHVQKVFNTINDDLITFSSKKKNKSDSSAKRSSTESAGNSPRKIINPPPSHHQDLLDDFNDSIKQKKNNRISKSETPEFNLHPIEKKRKKQTNDHNRKKNLSNFYKNSNIDEDYENSEYTEESNEFGNKKMTDFDIQKMKSSWTAPNVQALQNHSSSPISYSPPAANDNYLQQKLSSSGEKSTNDKSLSQEQSSPKNAFENLRSSDDSDDEINQGSNLITSKEHKNEQNNKTVNIDANLNNTPKADYDLISFSPMKPRNTEDLLLFSQNSAKKDENAKRRRVPNSPLTPKNVNINQEGLENGTNKDFTPNHLFFVNANSVNSDDYEYSPFRPNPKIIPQDNQENKDKNNIDDNSKTNSDLMGFTIIETKNNVVPTSPLQKLEIIPIEPIEPINSKENPITPHKVVTDSLIAEFLDFGGNSPQKDNSGIKQDEIKDATKNEQEELKDVIKNERDDSSNQNQELNENSNLISLSIEKTPENLNRNANNNRDEKEPELENSEIVLSCSLLSPTPNAHINKRKVENLPNEDSHASIENSNFISFSNVENVHFPMNTQQLSPAASPPKIEILSFSEQTDPNIIPPEKMNLSIFNSPLKPGEDPSKKYKLDSSDILNFSKHSSESQKQNDDNDKDINNNNLSSSSPSLLQTNYDDKESNKANSNVLSEYSEKADSERVDSPDRGNYIDLFKSPNKVSYINNKKSYGVSLFSEGLSPNNINKLSSGSHAKNMNGSISSSPTSESASESVAVSTSTLSTSSPYKHARREPKKAIAMLNKHLISIDEESSSGHFNSSSVIDAAKSQQQKEQKPSTPLQEKTPDAQENNNQSAFNTEFNKFVTGDKNELLKTYENSEANVTYNESENEIDKSKGNNTDITPADIIEEEEEDNNETFNNDLVKNETEEENLDEFNEDEKTIKADNNEEEEDFIPNTKNSNDSNDEPNFHYSVELQSIPTLPSKNNDLINNGITAGSTKAKRLTNEEVNAIQKKFLGNFGNEIETETENETEPESYRNLDEENGNVKNDNADKDPMNYRKKKPTSAFMFSQNDYSYSEIDSENKFSKVKDNDNNNQYFEEETIENEKEEIENEKENEEIESENEKEDDIENEKEDYIENDIENENAFENDSQLENNNNKDDSFIDSELAEAIAERNFNSQVVHDLVHFVTGVPKRVSKNKNLSGSLNMSGNLNNTSMIDNEDTIFAFQERFVSIIEVEILTNEGEVINIFPTNLNDYLKDRNTFLSEEKKEHGAKPATNKPTKKQTKSENSKKNQNSINDNAKSPKENSKSPARNKSPQHTSFIKSPSNYNSPYKGPSPKKKIADKSPSKQTLNNRQSPSQLAKSPSSKKQNTKKQRDSIEPFGTTKPGQQKQQKKLNSKGKLNNNKKQSIEIENENEFDNENRFEINEENEIETENANLDDNSNDEFISVSTPTKSPKSSKSSTPMKEKNSRKSSAFENNNDFDDDDQNNEFVSASTPKKKQSKALNSSTNSPYNKRQTGSNVKNSNLNKNKRTPNSSNTKSTKQNRDNQFSQSNNDEPSDLDDFTPVQTQQVTKKINNTVSPSPFVGNSLTKPKRIESDSGDSFLNASNNNSDEVNSSSILIENNGNNNNYDPDEFVSVSANATPPQKTNSNTNSNQNQSKAKNSIAGKSPLKENASTNSNKKKQPTTRKSLPKKTTTPNSDDFLPQQETTQPQQQKQKSGIQSNSNANPAASKKKPTQSNVTRMKPGLLGHLSSNNNNNNSHNNNNTNQATSSAYKKETTNEQLNHQNPFAKGKNKGLQFSLRKPLKKASAVNKKAMPNNERDENLEDEDEEINNNDNIENDTNFDQVNAMDEDEPQIPTTSSNRRFNEDKQTNAKKNAFSKQQKQKQNEISPAQPPKSPKTGSSKKKTQLLSPKSIEDPFKSLKASKQQQNQQNSSNAAGGGSGRKKKNSFQPITKGTTNNQTTGKKKKAQSSSATGNPPSKKNIMNETNAETSNSSSSFQMAFNIDTSLFSDANFAKKCNIAQASPNKKPKTLASVLIPANDDYSEED